ncbi:MAG: diguanylate cyclase domain-containing protein [Thiohalomonadaceae bacterium]
MNTDTTAALDNDHHASRSFVFYAILLVIAIMLAISLTGFLRIRVISAHLDHVIHHQATQSAQMYEMRRASQDRLLILLAALIEPDPFTFDAHATAMGEAAERYMQARIPLMQMALNEQEHALLARQNDQTIQTGLYHTEVMNLLRDEQVSHAASVLINQALPSQRLAMEMMDEFIQLKREQNLQTLQSTASSINNTYRLMLLLGGIGILLSLAIALVVSRRINNEMARRLRSEARLRKQELHERTIRDNIIDGVLTLHDDGRILSSNRACTTIFGYSKDALQGQLVSLLLPPAQRQRLERRLPDYLRRWGARLTGTGKHFTCMRMDGSEFPAEMDISSISLDGEEVFIIVVRDISEQLAARQQLARLNQELEQRVRERTEELSKANAMLRDEIDARVLNQQKLEHLAKHDSLTQLPNRANFSEQLDIAIHQARRHQRLVALLFLDLDGFKAINDQHGHGIGDKILIEVAQRLSLALRREDMVARMGGDEFTVLLREINKAEDATLVAQKLLETINRPYLIDEHLCQLGTSIGIAIFPHNARDPDNLLRLADDAMYAAKESGKNTWCLTAYTLSSPAQIQTAEAP